MMALGKKNNNQRTISMKRSNVLFKKIDEVTYLTVTITPQGSKATPGVHILKR